MEKGRKNKKIMEITEAFVSGFCKAQNQSRMVLCEYRQEPDGTKTFLESDCAYGTCSHSRQCALMEQAIEMSLRKESFKKSCPDVLNEL